MIQSNTLTLPFLAIIATTSLSVTQPVNIPPNVPASIEEGIYQTTSVNSITNKFIEPISSADLREKAIMLFGKQSSFTHQERMTYEEVMRKKSVSTGLNIFDLLSKR